MLSTLANRTLRPMSRAAPRFNVSVPRVMQAMPMSTAVAEEEEKPLIDFSAWNVQLPIGIMLAVPLLRTEMLILSEESQLVGVFSLFVAIAYNQGGTAIGDMLDARGKDLLAEYQASEIKEIESRKEEIANYEAGMEVYEELKVLDAAELELYGKLNAAVDIAGQKKVVAEVTALLDLMVAKKAAKEDEAQRNLVASVTKEVKQMFAEDPKLKASVLAASLETIAKPGQPAKNDPVQATFMAVLKKQTAALSAAAAVKPDAEQEKAAEDEAEAILAPLKGDSVAAGTPDEQVAWLKTIGMAK